MNDLLSFNDFMDCLTLSSIKINKKKFWNFCCQDLRSEKTGDVFWWGSELSSESEKAGYIEDWKGVYEYFKNK